MKNTEKHQQWVFYKDVPVQKLASGVERKVLAFCDEMMCVEHKFTKGQAGDLHSHPHTQITYVASGEFEFQIGDEKRIVKTGDTLLKENGVTHGCVCIESGSLIDFFNPMREDFIK